MKKLQCIHASKGCKELIKQGYYPIEAIMPKPINKPLKTCVYKGIEQIELHHYNKNKLSAFIKL